MARILRGDIFWADLEPTRGHEQAGLRPVLVLSREAFNERSETVIAVVITSKAPRAGFPLTLEVQSAKLPKQFSQIRTLSIERLGACLGHLSPEEVSQGVEGLNEIVGDK